VDTAPRPRCERCNVNCIGQSQGPNGEYPRDLFERADVTVSTRRSSLNTASHGHESLSRQLYWWLMFSPDTDTAQLAAVTIVSSDVDASAVSCGSERFLAGQTRSKWLSSERFRQARLLLSSNGFNNRSELDPYRTEMRDRLNYGSAPFSSGPRPGVRQPPIRGTKMLHPPRLEARAAAGSPSRYGLSTVRYLHHTLGVAMLRYHALCLPDAAEPFEDGCT
jgi:hypothetical protein